MPCLCTLALPQSSSITNRACHHERLIQSSIMLPFSKTYGCYKVSKAFYAFLMRSMMQECYPKHLNQLSVKQDHFQTI